MSRLVVAVLILFAVLIGLRFANASMFQRNVTNQIDSAASATRNTGFSVESTGVSSGTGVASQSASTQTQNQADTAAETTALPPSQQTGIPARW